MNGIAGAIAEELTKTRGSHRAMLDIIDPKRTAHLIIDMQNGFTMPGAAVEIVAARSIIPAINAISDAVRDAGGINIFLQYSTEGAADNWSTWFRHFMNADHAEKLLETFMPGNAGFDLNAAIDIQPGDLKVSKTRFGSFVPGTSNLQAVLEARGIDTLIITGTATNVCCESTARDAMQLNYKVIVVADATAALTEAEHRNALSAVGAFFADIVSTEEVLDQLRLGPDA